MAQCMVNNQDDMTQCKVNKQDDMTQCIVNNQEMHSWKSRWYDPMHS